MSATDHADDRIVHVDDDTYRDSVSDGLVLLDFWAEWCGPCTALEPVIEELVEANPQLTIAKIDTDENEETMDEFGVKSIPTMILFHRGQPVEVFTGTVTHPKLEQAVEQHA